VQYRAGEVEDAAYLAALLGGQALAAAAQEDLSAQFGSAELAVANRFAQVAEQLAQGGEHGVAAMTLDQREAGRVA
jgi:hypothetical protein